VRAASHLPRVAFPHGTAEARLNFTPLFIKSAHGQETLPRARVRTGPQPGEVEELVQCVQITPLVHQPLHMRDVNLHAVLHVPHARLHVLQLLPEVRHGLGTRTCTRSQPNKPNRTVS